VCHRYYAVSKEEQVVRELLVLLRKDLLVEARRREALATLLFLSVLLGVVVALGIHNSFVQPSVVYKLTPTLFWVVFILAGSVSIGKTSEYDQQLRAIDGVLLSGVSYSTMYVAKTLSNLIIILVGQVVAFFTFALLLNVDVSAIFGEFMVVALGVVVAYSSLLTLLSGIASSSRLRSLLLPLIALPLMFPLFFCAVEICGELFANRQVAWDSVWVSLLLGLDVVYFVLGLNLYEYVIRD
jgi:heme exporter protein B